jgi:hypothetical protein
MQTLFVILFLLSGLGLVVGLIKPSLFKQTRKMILLMFGGAAVVFFIAIAIVSPSQSQTPAATVAASESPETSTPTAQPTQEPVTTAKKTTPQAQTSDAANTSAPVVQTPKPAPQPTAQLNISGSGSKSTQTFTVGKSWTLDWTYDCSNFGGKGNFQVFVYTADGSMSFNNSGVNQLGASGADTEYYHTAGSYYLEVNSECNWTISVKG